MTIPKLKAKHEREMRKLITDTLNRLEWSLTRSAAALRVTVSSLQRALKRHGLYDEYRERTGWRGPGQPRRTAS